jgi:hypothetical protein
MKRLSHKVALLALAAAVAYAPLVTVQAANLPQVAGTWQILGIPDEGGCGPDDPFGGIASISLDGTVVTADPFLGPGFGEAYRVSGDRYAVGFFISPAPPVFFRTEVQSELELINQDQASGRFRTLFADPVSGEPFCVYEGDLTAQRLEPTGY